MREIARTIEVSASTISREIKRNKSKHAYPAAYAHMLARERIQWRQYPRRFTADLKRPPTKETMFAKLTMKEIKDIECVLNNRSKKN